MENLDDEIDRLCLDKARELILVIERGATIELVAQYLRTSFNSGYLTSRIQSGEVTIQEIEEQTNKFAN